jgi:hypothetical protein
MQRWQRTLRGKAQGKAPGTSVSVVSLREDETRRLNRKVIVQAIVSFALAGRYV